MRKLRDLNNLWWRDYPSECITHEEFVNLYNSLDKKDLAKSKTQCKDWDIGKWYIDKGKYNNTKFEDIDVHDMFQELHLYIFTENGPMQYWCNALDNAKNKRAAELGKPAGYDAYYAVADKFKEQYGITLRQAFGTVEEQFKNCVPKQFYWFDESYANKILHHISAIDFCSQYPSNVCGPLPDSHTAVIRDGRVAPTEEYPFAFYLSTGTLAEYGKYDTSTWINDMQFADNLLNGNQLLSISSYDKDRERTILMKASKYTLDDIMKYYYALRHTDASAKLVMNAFIGMLHRRNYRTHKFAHIAAVAIARSNNKMLQLVQSKIEKPIHICVDGCIYEGDEEYGVHEKGLGLCNQEFTDCDVKIKCMNCYVVMKDGKPIKWKHGGADARTDGKDVDNYCEGFEYLDKICRKTNVKNVINDELEDNEYEY